MTKASNNKSNNIMSMSANNEPVQPEWPTNVMVFKPTDMVADILARIKHTEDPTEPYELNGEIKVTHNTQHHFDTKHYALLFEPGEYKDCKFEVGYYVQMAGLGANADDVKFSGDKSGPYVEALNKHMSGGSNQDKGMGLCLDTFWRSAENFSSINTQWAVSQAAPIRRVHVQNELMMGDGGAYSSGGFVANAHAGSANYAANQQWFSRACNFDVAQGGAWSTVFAGCTGQGIPKDNAVTGTNVHTNISEPGVRMEKPFIAINADGNYDLHVPKVLHGDGTSGADLGASNNEVRSFANVKVGKPVLPTNEAGEYVNHDSGTYNNVTPEDEKITNDLQQALDDGKDLVLCPGLFFLSKSLVVKKPNQVILGLGLATLVAPQDGSPCIQVKANTAGVRVAGLMLEASKQGKATGKASDGQSSLLSFGELDVTDDAGDAANPGLISDIFTRVGGSNPDRTVNTDIMVRVHSGNVVGDNLWLWRADHVKLLEGQEANDPELPLYWQTRIWKDVDGKKTRIDECVTKNALEVTGDDVNMYGLFCEHTTEHQLVWKGERGSTTFFQCELPYDVDIDYANNDFTGYHVHPSVEVHTARGIGVYSNFQEYPVIAPTGIQMPSKEGIVLQNPYTIFLNNKGGIRNVIKQGGVLIGDACHEDVQGIPQRAWQGENRVSAVLSSSSEKKRTAVSSGLMSIFDRILSTKGS